MNAHIPALAMISLLLLTGCGETAAVRTTPPEIPTLTSEQLQARLAGDEKVVVLDVREENEYAEVHIPDAIWFPKSRFDKKDPDLLAKLESFDSDSVLVAYCGAGHRSSFVTRKLREMGYEAYNLQGISYWKAKGLPVVEGPKRPPGTEPAIVALEEAYEHYYLLFDDIVWIDVRERSEFARGHIEGAVNIPTSEIVDHADSLPKETKEFVLYCEGKWEGGTCSASLSAARMLIDVGFTPSHVKVFESGYEAWKHAGYPIVK